MINFPGTPSCIGQLVTLRITDDDGDDLWRPAGTVLFEHEGRLVKDRPAVSSPAPPIQCRRSPTRFMIC